MNLIKKINILHIIKSLGRGGAEMLLPETLKLHDQHRFEFRYIYFLPWKNQLVEALEQAGGKVVCMQASNNLQMLAQISRIIRYCREHNIRLIHCHLPWAGIIGRLLHKRTGLPVIYTEHNKQERYHMATRLINKLTFNWQTMAVSVSGDAAESIQKHIRPRIKVKEIPNGVNTSFFQRDEPAGQLLRRQLGIPDDAVVVGTVAVFRFQKRLKEWLEVFCEASRANDKLAGIIVGDGPLKAELEAHVIRLGLNQLVIMPGIQTEVRPWYSAMDIFMMTSVFEGLPVALLEAMSMQCAVVTTDAGGIKEVIRDGMDGIVVPADRWEDLPDKVTQLVRSKKDRAELGKSARKRVEDKFSLSRMVVELENLYIELYKNP